jgi:dTDP-4-amino-4,6-dideoxygalactose transaminase
MRETFLSFSPPSIGEDEIEEVVEALRSGWITTGPRTHLFEEQFAEVVGAPAAHAVNSGTAAMHVGLAAAGVGPGDRVVTTPMTFSSSAHVIEHLGATPVFVDVDPETLNIDPQRVADVASGARAILPVHLYGHPCDMPALLDIAEQSGALVLEDSAHALAASVAGRQIGTPASDHPDVLNLVAFSFYATKNLTTAEGGMLVGPPEVVKRARVWSLHGMSHDAFDRYTEHGSWYYEVVLPGFKYNLTDLQAALGLVQLRRLPEMQQRRLAVARRYAAAFATVPEVEAPPSRPNVDHAWHVYSLRLNLDRLTIDRSRFIEELRARNIGTSVHFIPLHLQPYYRDRYHLRPEDFPIATREYYRLVSLPLHPGLTDQDVDDVIDAVAEVADRYRR